MPKEVSGVMIAGDASIITYARRAQGSGFRV